MLKLIICLILVTKPIIASSCDGDCDDKGLVLTNNRYDGLVIAINPEVPEDQELITKLQNIWTDASKVLWRSTNNRAYFGEITILVPKTWSSAQTGNGYTATYDNAHVVVAKENPAFGNGPYTMQYGECGTSGEYIHLTPDYITNEDEFQDYGPKGKAMVHEWAHFRWGVYSESPTPGTNPYYYDMKESKYQATRCPVSLTGRNVYVDTTTGEYRDCQISQETNWLPEDGCLFLPDKVQKANSSMMSHHYMDDIVTFCHDDDEKDPLNRHNRDAPSEHNRLCQQRSVWNIMDLSKDFKNNNLPNPTIQNVMPTFKIVKTSIPRFVLVLETSDNMKDGTKFSDMIAGAIMFVDQFVPIGSAVGIVDYSTSSTVVQVMLEITSDNDRANLVNRLKNIGPPGGRTCVGCGIQTAIQILDSSPFGTAGAHIIIMVAGEENEYPYVADVEYQICSKEVIIDPIFFGPSVNSDLQRVAINTCGHMMPGLEDLQKLIEIYKALTEGNHGDLQNQVFQVYGESYTVGPADYESGIVPLDSTVGKNTVFTITWSQYSTPPIVNITRPDKEVYCSMQNQYCFGSVTSVDTSTKIMKFVIPGIAQNGDWVYQIFGRAHTQKINVMVTTMAADESIEPIVIKATTSTTSVTSGQPLVINAMVTQGYEPIIGANVEATITNTNDGTVSLLSLYDDGSAPDARISDGVYSRYFTGFTNSGRYSVKVTATGAGSKTTSYLRGSAASFFYGYIDTDGTVVLNPNIANRPNEKEQCETRVDPRKFFKRTVETAGFLFSGNANTPNNDNYPPSQVIDLSVNQKDPLDTKKGVVLTFTTPGDKDDEGTAQPTCVNEKGQKVTGQPFRCETDCTKYYQCGNGVLYETVCPPGLVFNPSRGYCDSLANVPDC